MTDLQAAVGVAQLARIEAFGRARRDNFAYFRQALAPLEEFFVLPEATPGSDPSWFGFLLMVRERAPFSRDEVVRALEDAKVQTRMLFGGNLTRQPALTELVKECRADSRPAPYRVIGELRVTDAIIDRALWFGVYPGITPAMREHVVDVLTRFVSAR